MQVSFSIYRFRLRLYRKNQIHATLAKSPGKVVKITTGCRLLITGYKGKFLECLKKDIIAMSEDKKHMVLHFVEINDHTGVAKFIWPSIAVKSNIVFYAKFIPAHAIKVSKAIGKIIFKCMVLSNIDRSFALFVARGISKPNPTENQFDRSWRIILQLQNLDRMLL